MAAQTATEPPVYRLGVDAYNRIVASGALEDERVELLEGVLARTIEVHTEPGADGYGRSETYDRESVLPSPLAGVEDLDVAALFAAIER